MDQDVAVKLAIYRHFAETGKRPTPAEIALRACVSEADVVASYEWLKSQRVLVLEPDGVSIRMAPPFSGVPTHHVVEAAGLSFYANCAWDAFGIPAALGVDAVVKSRCGQSGEPLRLAVGPEGHDACDWWFHCAVPAAKWWDDIVFT